MWREILRRRSVGFGLALVVDVGVSVFARAFRFYAGMLVMFFVMLSRFAEMFCAVRIIAGAFVRNAVLRFADGFFVMLRSAAKRFTGEQLNGVHGNGRNSGRGSVRWLVRVAVVVVFEIFENVADVEKSIAIEADINECRLHARKDPGYFSFVDAADESELFFALDVDFN
jgi:hypothetical protein